MEALRKVSKEARRILPSVFGVLSYFHNEIVEVHAGSSRLTRNNSEGMGSGRAAMERAGVAAGGHTPETANSDQSKAEIVVH